MIQYIHISYGNWKYNKSIHHHEIHVDSIKLGKKNYIRLSKNNWRCHNCEGTDLQKNGKSTNGTQRYFCKTCQKQFCLDYRYNAYKLGDYFDIPAPEELFKIFFLNKSHN
jgi:transposase-like protein